LLERSIAETAVVITGSLGRGWRVISCKFGHTVGMVIIIEATIGVARLGSKFMILMTVVLGERNKGVYGIDSPGTLQEFPDSETRVRRWREAAEPETPKTGGPATNIVRAFASSEHTSESEPIPVSSGVFCSFQTSVGKDLSNGSNSSWISHSTSNTKSSGLLQQLASATAVALAFDATSSQVINRTISSRLRQACIGPRRCV